MNVKHFIEQFKKNDYSNFDEFYNLTSKQIYFTALGILKTPDKAEDIVQDTYKSFLENIDSYKDGANVFAYLTVIARNKSINVYKKYRKISFDQEAVDNLSCDGDFEIGGVEEILSLIEDSADREIVVYHILLDYKFKEIANIMKKPLGTVLWKYNRAMKILRERVSEIEK